MKQKHKDRVVEITAYGTKGKKNEKKEGQSERPLGQQQAHRHSHYTGSRRGRERKGPGKVFEEIIAETFGVERYHAMWEPEERTEVFRGQSDSC